MKRQKPPAVPTPPAKKSEPSPGRPSNVSAQIESPDYVRGARPLPARALRVPPATRSAPKAEGRPARTHDETMPVFEMQSDESTIEGARVGFARRVRELSRGFLPVFETLDLHGYTVEKAEKAVRDFCSSARGPVARTVLLVHGKGRHSQGGRSVLRDEIALWLSSAPVARDVLCFVTACSKHGGSGAMYVLLAARAAGSPGATRGPRPPH